MVKVFILLWYFTVLFQSNSYVLIKIIVAILKPMKDLNLVRFLYIYFYSFWIFSSKVLIKIITRGNVFGMRYL